jgi:hypothetical protein
MLLFVTLPLDGVMESKRGCKSDDETKKRFKFMKLDDKIRIYLDFPQPCSRIPVNPTQC